MWSDDLAAAAEAFSLQCRQESNPDRAAQVPSFESVGENWSAVGTRAQPNYTTIITVAWFNRRSLYDFTENSCSTSGACSFYTQVWVCGYVGMWVCGYMHAWVCEYVGMWVCGCMNVWVCGYVGMWDSWV